VTNIGLPFDHPIWESIVRDCPVHGQRFDYFSTGPPVTYENTTWSLSEPESEEPPVRRCGMVNTLELAGTIIGAIVFSVVAVVVWERYFGGGDPHG
jgi:hypothetical protein